MIGSIGSAAKLRCGRPPRALSDVRAGLRLQIAICRIADRAAIQTSSLRGCSRCRCLLVARESPQSARELIKIALGCKHPLPSRDLKLHVAKYLFGSSTQSPRFQTLTARKMGPEPSFCKIPCRAWRLRLLPLSAHPIRPDDF